MTRRIVIPLLPLALGLIAWAYAVGQLRPSQIGSYGVLASASVLLPLGFIALLAGFLFELRNARPRGWLLATYLVCLVAAIFTAVPIAYSGVPEYSWVYKHIGVAQSLGHYGRVTDPSSIYQRWPVFFAAVSGASALGHLAPLSFAAWAPVAFELADAVVLLGVFTLLSGDRRVAFLGVLLHVCLISWIGQDYLSPQAFGYLLWLGIALVYLRWLRAPARNAEVRGWFARLRAFMLVGLEPPPAASAAQRNFAVAIVAVTFFAVVAAHQLTPYMALGAVGALTLLDQVRPRWLFLLLAALAVGFLIPRYSLVSEDFGGVFSGLNPLQNASTLRGASHAGAEAFTARIVRGLAAGMWLFAIAVVVRRIRTLGRVVIPAVLAFSPFLVLLAQSYGGEAIFRVYLFSAPWCAFLIASALLEMRASVRRMVVVIAACTITLFAGLQGLYGPTRIDAFTPAELAASRWLYAGHIPRGSLIVLPVDDFPTLEAYDYNAYDLERMPADLQLDVDPWMDEANLAEVDHWVAGLGHRNAYVVFSRNMGFYAGYFVPPTGFLALRSAVPTAPRWSVVYSNVDVKIYRLSLG